MFVTVISLLLNTTGVEIATKREADIDGELKALGLANLAAAALGGYVSCLSLSRTTLDLRPRRQEPACRPDCRGHIGADARRRSGFPRLRPQIRHRRRSARRRLRAAAPLDRAIGAAIEPAGIYFTARRRLDHRPMGLHRWRADRRGDRLRDIRREREPRQRHQVRLRRFGIPQPPRPQRRGTGDPCPARSRAAGHVVAELSLLRLGQPALPARQGAAAKQPGCRFLVFDFRLVTGIDSSATHSFSQIKQVAGEAGARLVLVNLAPGATTRLPRHPFFVAGRDRCLRPRSGARILRGRNHRRASGDGRRIRFAARLVRQGAWQRRARRRRSPHFAAASRRGPARSSRGKASRPIPCISSSTAASAFS